MKQKLVLAATTLLLTTTNSWAAQEPYYSVEEISVDAGNDANYGPYPSAISDDGSFIGTYSMKASLSKDIDIGLPFTFNRSCPYASVFCRLEFYGSQSAADSSYNNAYQAWRNAQTYAAAGYSSYMMGNSFATDTDTDTPILPYDSAVAADTASTDVKITDVTGDSGADQFIVGYSSAPYSGGTRDFVRRAFIYNQTQNALSSLLPDFTTNGGFSSAYKIKDVTYTSGMTKTLVVGAGSVSFPKNEQSYFNSCYFSHVYDDILSVNELVNCPGFDTQAWAWDVTDLNNITSIKLASKWLDDNTSNNNLKITYSAAALDINASGIAVGVSTFKDTSDAQGGRQRAIIMMPDDNGDYAAPTELTAAVADAGKDAIYNSWATAITDNNMVIGNREYSVPISVNKPTEFFVYDITDSSIRFPLKNKKVLTTKQRLNGTSAAKAGANSRAYDLNESGFIVGKADDYDQSHPVDGGMPRSQSGFLYNKDSDKSWFINDLICSADDNGVITSPLYKIRSARVINDNGTVLAEGWKYSSASDYQNETNASEVMLKLTRNSAVSSPDDSPNCWQSDLLNSEDGSYQRAGAASLWLWIFALPLLLVRRFCK
ncbi:MAG: DUF3466 family protein [Psychromonas sp.]|nr:DUF3466 family protein [Psychromonas sp.]